MIKSRARAAVAAVALSAATLFGAAGTLAVAAPAVAAPAPLLTQAPGAADLQAKLTLALDTSADRGARAAELEGGEASLPMMDQLGGAVAAVPGFAWHVEGPTSVTGDLLTANMMTTVPGFGSFPPIEVSWRQIDGTWKLTRDAQCTLGYYASLSC